LEPLSQYPPGKCDRCDACLWSFRNVNPIDIPYDDGLYCGPFWGQAAVSLQPSANPGDIVSGYIEISYSGYDWVVSPSQQTSNPCQGLTLFTDPSQVPLWAPPVPTIYNGATVWDFQAGPTYSVSFIGGCGNTSYINTGAVDGSNNPIGTLVVQKTWSGRCHMPVNCVQLAWPPPSKKYSNGYFDKVAGIYDAVYPYTGPAPIDGTSLSLSSQQTIAQQLYAAETDSRAVPTGKNLYHTAYADVVYQGVVVNPTVMAFIRNLWHPGGIATVPVPPPKP
jgi:hypothetical protein